MNVVTGRPTIAEQGWGLTRSELLDEDCDDGRLAMGSLARPINVAKPANSMTDAGRLRPGSYVRLTGKLRGAVGRQWMRQIVLGGRCRSFISIESPAGGGEDDWNVEHRGRFEYVESSSYVDLAIKLRVGDGCSDA